MAEWSQLPRELLDLIAQRLESSFYTLRFRSVCSSWRSSVSAERQRLPGRFPFLPNYGISDTTWGFHLSRRSIFVVRSPDSQSKSVDWLVKIEEYAPGRVQLLHPLSRYITKSLPQEFPKLLDLMKFPVFELGEEYVLHYTNYRPTANFHGETGNFYREKVVFRCLDSEIGEFILLTIHISGKLAMFKSGDKMWNIIPEMAMPYDDVIEFKGEFYAVDHTGRTVLVGLCNNVSLVAEPVFGGDKKVLVESNGEILLVDVYLTERIPGDGEAWAGIWDNDEREAWVGIWHYDEFLPERMVRFKVFKLVGEKEKKWVEIDNLGNRVLFIGDDCAFSAPTSGLSGCKGNCILFTDNFFCLDSEENGLARGNDIGVYDLDNKRISPLADFPDYLKLFWPPPDWVTATSLQVQRQFENLNA